MLDVRMKIYTPPPPPPPHRRRRRRHRRRIYLYIHPNSHPYIHVSYLYIRSCLRQSISLHPYDENLTVKLSIGLNYHQLAKGRNADQISIIL